MECVLCRCLKHVAKDNNKSHKKRKNINNGIRDFDINKVLKKLHRKLSQDLFRRIKYDAQHFYFARTRCLLQWQPHSFATSPKEIFTSDLWKQYLVDAAVDVATKFHCYPFRNSSKRRDLQKQLHILRYLLVGLRTVFQIGKFCDA